MSLAIFSVIFDISPLITSNIPQHYFCGIVDIFALPVVVTSGCIFKNSIESLEILFPSLMCSSLYLVGTQAAQIFPMFIRDRQQD